MGRAFSQAQKFGVEMAIPDEAVKLECGNDPCHVQLATGERIQARSRRARHRRALPPARGRPARGVRGLVGPLLGLAARGRSVRGAGGRAGRRRQFGGPGGGFPRRPGAQGHPGRAAAARRDHVAISGRADREPAQCRGGDRLRDRGAGRRAGWSCRSYDPPAFGSEASGKSRVRFLFSFIGAEPNTDWLQSSGIKLDSRGLRAHRRRRRRRAPAARNQPPRRVRGRRRPLRARSSASRPRSATARRSSRRSTPTSPRRRSTASLRRSPFRSPQLFPEALCRQPRLA